VREDMVDEFGKRMSSERSEREREREREGIERVSNPMADTWERMRVEMERKGINSNCITKNEK
jgi:hypothetical protein